MLTRVVPIFVQAFLVISVSSEKCEITTPDGKLKAGETLELVAGESLDLKCTAPHLPEGENLTFSWKNVDLSGNTETFPAERRAVLRVENTVPFAGISHVYCGYGGYQDCGKHVLIGYPPVKPQNIRCVSQALKEMTCTWDQVKGEDDLKILTNWTLSYRIGHRSDMVNCPDQRKTQDTCFWSSTNSDDVRLAFKRGLRYRMVVTAYNALNTTQSDEIVVDPDTIVKPNRVPVIAGPELENGTLAVTMEIPYHIEQVIKQFEYTLNVTCLSGRNESDAVIQGIGKGPVSFRLHNLVPNSKYRLSGMIKPDASGYWSDPNDVEIVTQEAAPETSPSEVAFTQCRGDSRDKRRVDVYWQYLHSSFSNGKITQYKVRVTSSAGTWTKNTTELSSPMTFDDLNMTGHYSLQMAASTSAGWGPYSQSVEIPPLDQELPLATDVIAESDADGEVSVNISWTTPAASQADSARIYVCPGHIERPMDVFLAKCEGDLLTEDVNLSTKTTRHWYEVTSRADLDVVIGVALMDARGTTGGITWAECLADRNTEPIQMRGLGVTDVETNAAVVRWTMLPCGVQIRGYQISYWPVTDTVKRDCDDGIKQDFQGGRKTVEALLNNLEEATKYIICARAMTASGKYAPWSETVTGETISPPPLLTIIVASVTGLFLTGLVIGICLMCWYIRKQIPFECVPEVKTEAIAPNYTYEEYTYVDEGEASQSPGEEQAHDKRDSGHESMSRSSESSTESSQHAVATGDDSSSAQSTAVVRLVQTEAISLQATPRPMCGDTVSQSGHEETEATHLLPSTGYVLETNLRKTGHHPGASDESRETTRLLGVSQDEANSFPSGACSEVYERRLNDLSYIGMGHNQYIERNSSGDEHSTDSIGLISCSTASKIYKQRKRDDSNSEVDNAGGHCDGGIQQALTGKLISSKGDNSSLLSEVDVYSRMDTSVYESRGSGSGMDSYSRIVEEPLGDSDFHWKDIHARTNSSDTVDSYSRLGASSSINSGTNPCNSALPSTSMADAGFEHEAGDNTPSSMLTSGPSTSANCADNGIDPYSKLGGEISADSEISCMRSSGGASVRHVDRVSVSLVRPRRHNRLSNTANSDRPAGRKRHSLGNLPLSSGYQLHPHDSRSYLFPSRDHQPQPTAHQGQPHPSDYQPHPSDYQPRPSDYQPHPSDYQPHPSDYQPHPSDYQSRPTEYQSHPQAYQRHPCEYQGHVSDNQHHLSEYRRHPSGYQSHPSGYQPHPSHCQRLTSEHQGQPCEYRSRVSDHQRDPSEYQRHPFDYQVRPSEYQHRLCDSQRRPSDYQRWLSDYQRRPSEYPHHTSSDQRRPSEYPHHTSSDQRRPSEYQRRPCEHQRHPFDYQPHPSNCQRQTSEYQRHLSQYEGDPFEYQDLPSEYPPPPSNFQCLPSYKSQRSLSDYQPEAAESHYEVWKGQPEASEHQQSADYSSSYSRFSAYPEVPTENRSPVYIDQPFTTNGGNCNVIENPKYADSTSVKLEKLGNVLCSACAVDKNNFRADKCAKQDANKPNKDDSILYSVCDAPGNRIISHCGPFAEEDVNCNNSTYHKGEVTVIDDLEFDNFLQEDVKSQNSNGSTTAGGGENSAVGSDERSAVGDAGGVASGGDESIASGGGVNDTSVGVRDIASRADGSSILSDDSLNRPAGDNASIVWVQRSKSSSPTAKNDSCVKETVL